MHTEAEVSTRVNSATILWHLMLVRVCSDRTSSLAGRMISLKYMWVLFSGVLLASVGGKLKWVFSFGPSTDSDDLLLRQQLEYGT